MALIASLASLLGAALFGGACAGLGHRILRVARLTTESDLENLLYSSAFGVISYLAGVALLEFTSRIRSAVVILLALFVVAGARELPSLWSAATRIADGVRAGSRREHLFATLVILTLSFQGTAALAPLTGSDALHYHFAAPMLVLRDGFVPNFSLVHSFFTGQGHLLILTGLALGSEKFALALIFLGGVLSAAACACLCRKWASREWAWLSALAFLLTPVAFWQISAAGAPDIWMAFFATVSVLFVARFAASPAWIPAVLTGALAGALAGAKYTGCILAIAIIIAFMQEARSVGGVARFFAGALAAGVWPYLRNLLWAHDPIFPFLTRWIAPEHVNPFTLASVIADTGANAHRSVQQLAQFPFFSAVDQTHAGFWQFFGPLVLALAPLVFLAVRNTPFWRAALIIWPISSLGIGVTSGMLRFLLPLLPIALAAAFAGVASLRRDWRFVRAFSSITVAVFLAVCAAGLAVYAYPAAAAGLGFVDREAYLRRHAPEYAKAEFINQTLQGKGSEGETLVFSRHVYYLQVPFVSGDPDTSWSIDPQRLNSPLAWRAFFAGRNIRWVVRAPEYPQVIAAPLKRLEAQGELIPVAQAEVSDFAGMRILDQRSRVPVVILKVKD